MPLFLVTKKFWHDLRSNPRDLLDHLRGGNHPLAYRAVAFVLFCRIAVSEFFLNHCLTRAMALAFALLLTLIPLLATAAFMLASIGEVKPAEVQKLLSMLLPFAPPTILEYIGRFYENARQLRGVGIGVLIFFTVSLFGTAEESLNAIWKVTRNRSFFVQLRTFTMVMVYGPLLLFASSQIRKYFQLGAPSDYFLLSDFVPLVLTALAFSLFIWMVPNTKVRFRSAVLGGVLAGALFEIERHGYRMYMELSTNTNTIYGAFGVIPFFVVSLFFVSVFVLVGVQISYVHQNFLALLRATRRGDRRLESHKVYIALRIVADVASAFTKKKPPPPIADIAVKYELTEAQAKGVTQWLIKAGYIHAVNGQERFVPALDLSNHRVKELLEALENEQLRISTAPDDAIKQYLTQLLRTPRAYCNPYLESLTFGKLIQDLDQIDAQAKNSLA